MWKTFQGFLMRKNDIYCWIKNSQEQKDKKNIDCQNCIYLKDFIKEYYTVKLNFIFAINVLKCWEQ